MALSSVELRQLGLAKETVRGTAESAPTKWYPVMKESDFDYKRLLLDDDAIRGIPDEFPKVAGRKRGTGKVRLPLDAQSCGEFFYSLLGAVTSTEQSILTVDNTNNKINFNIGAGELTATVSNGSYAIGTADSQSGTLCDAIKDAIVAAEATGTYTVTYSRTTKKFTIARSAGTFQILWKTGTNGSDNTDTHIGDLIGYTDSADDTGSLSYTADSETQYAFVHAFTRHATSIERPSYTFFLDRGLNDLKYNLGTVKKVMLTGPVDGLVMMDNEVLFKTEASGDTGSPTYPTQRYFSFQHCDVKVAGSSNTDVKSWTLEIDNGAQPLETLNESADIADILVRGRSKITGSFVIFFQNATERDKFIAAETTSLRFLLEGATISGSFKWTVDVTLPKVNYTAFPYDEEEGLLAAKVTFEAVYDSTTSKAISVDVTNQDASY